MEEEKQLTSFLTQLGIGASAATGYAAALVAEGFDTTAAFALLTAEELRDDFGFKRGHLRMVERKREREPEPKGPESPELEMPEGPEMTKEQEIPEGKVQASSSEAEPATESSSEEPRAARAKLELESPGPEPESPQLEPQPQPESSQLSKKALKRRRAKANRRARAAAARAAAANTKSTLGEGQALQVLSAVRDSLFPLLGVIALWRCRRVSREFNSWARHQLRALAPALVLGGSRYHFGPAEFPQDALDSTELLQWEDLRWEPRAPLPAARAGFGLAVAGGDRPGLVVAAGTYPEEERECLLGHPSVTKINVITRDQREFGRGPAPSPEEIETTFIQDHESSVLGWTYSVAFNCQPALPLFNQAPVWEQSTSGSTWLPLPPMDIPYNWQPVSAHDAPYNIQRLHKTCQCAIVNVDRDGPKGEISSDLIVIGGHKEHHAQYVRRYSQATQTWTDLPPLRCKRSSGFAVGLLLDGRLIVAGGDADRSLDESPHMRAARTEATDDVEALQIAHGQYDKGWTILPRMTLPRSGCTGCVLPDGRFLVSGGLAVDRSASSAFIPTASCECFDPQVGVWSAFAPLNIPRTGHCMTVVGESVVVTGGCTHDSSTAGHDWLNWQPHQPTALSSAELVDVTGASSIAPDKPGQWKILPHPMAHGRAEHGLASDHSLKNRPVLDVLGRLGRHGSYMSKQFEDGQFEEKYMCMDMSDPISQRKWVVDPSAQGTARAMEFEERTIGINKPGHGRMVKKEKYETYRDRLTFALMGECNFEEQRCSIIEELLTWGPGADVQACTDDQRCTPLYFACSRNNLKTAELLLKHRANPDVTGPKGPRPIEMAALGGHAEMIELLFAYGADPEATPSADVWLQRSDTMLNLLIKHALVEQHAKCVELLRKKKQELADAAGVPVSAEIPHENCVMLTIVDTVTDAGTKPAPDYQARQQSSMQLGKCMDAYAKSRHAERADIKFSYQGALLVDDDLTPDDLKIKKAATIHATFDSTRMKTAAQAQLQNVKAVCIEQLHTPGKDTTGPLSRKYNGVYSKVGEHDGWHYFRNARGMHLSRWSATNKWILYGTKFNSPRGSYFAYANPIGGEIPVGINDWSVWRSSQKDWKAMPVVTSLLTLDGEVEEHSERILRELDAVCQAEAQAQLSDVKACVVDGLAEEWNGLYVATAAAEDGPESSNLKHFQRQGGDRDRFLYRNIFWGQWVLAVVFDPLGKARFATTPSARTEGTLPVGKTGWSKFSKSKFVDVAITISLVKDELELQDLVAKEHERELQRQWGLKPPTAVPSFAVGDKCRLHSLRGRPELNGRVGTIQKLLSDRGRWKISLHPVQLPGAVTAPTATAQSMAVKSANLLPAHAPLVASCELSSELLEHAKDDPYCKGCANRCCTVIQKVLADDDHAQFVYDHDGAAAAQAALEALPKKEQRSRAAALQGQLFAAIMDYDHKQLRQCLAARRIGLDVDRPEPGDPSRCTPLIRACIRGNLVAVEMLISEGGADVNCSPPGRDDMGPLAYATLQSCLPGLRGNHKFSLNHAAIAHVLLKNKADINYRAQGCSHDALMACIQGAMIPGPDGDLISAEEGVSGGHIDMARMLIHAGAAINPPRTPMSSPLAMAAQVGAFDIVSYLLENDADVNAVAEAGGNTPLMVVLGKVGRDPTTTPTAELIAFDIAAELIEAGADVNIVNHNGFSCLHEASEYGYDRILKLMLSKGGDMELKLPRGKHTAFHLACESGHLGCVQLLVRAGCDTTAQTEDGLTGLQILKDCARTGTDEQQPANWQIAQWLLEEMAAGRIAEEEPDYIKPGQCAQQ